MSFPLSSFSWGSTPSLSSLPAACLVCEDSARRTEGSAWKAAGRTRAKCPGQHESGQSRARVGTGRRVRGSAPPESPLIPSSSRQKSRLEFKCWLLANTSGATNAYLTALWNSSQRHRGFPKDLVCRECVTPKKTLLLRVMFQKSQIIPGRWAFCRQEPSKEMILWLHTDTSALFAPVAMHFLRHDFFLSDVSSLHFCKDCAGFIFYLSKVSWYRYHKREIKGK